MIDIHSHILPDIDDGARTVEESMEIIKNASKNGVTDLIVTPHFILGSDYEADNVTKRKLVTKLKRRITKEKLPINIYLGNEVFIENDMLKLKKDGLVSTLNNSRYLLFELPLNDRYIGVSDILFQLGCKGYKGIIAHPERYAIVKKDPSIVFDFIEKGALIQCNIGSFFGHYGSKAKHAAILLLKHHAISFIGSDIHHSYSDYYDKLEELKKLMRKYISEEEIEDILVNNARKILKKEMIVEPKVKPLKKNMFGKWK